MTFFTLRRLGSALLVMFAISILTFLIFQAIPNGDPATRMAGRTATAQTIENIRHEYGFDQPIWVQYLRTMQHIFSGQVISYTQQLNVTNEIVRSLPATISLAVGACALALLIGALLGLLAATRAGGLVDRGITVFALVGVSTPVFFLAAIMLYLLSYVFPIFPSGGYVPLTQDPVQWLYHMVLPWITLSLLAIGVYSRLLRAQLLDRMNDDFVRTAVAKGIGQRRVLLRHVLRLSIMPVISVWGLDFAATLGGGAILIETVFNLHGVGQLAATSIATLDVPPLLVIVMYASFFVVIIGALSDIVNTLLDPRIKLGGS